MNLIGPNPPRIRRFPIGFTFNLNAGSLPKKKKAPRSLLPPWKTETATIPKGMQIDRLIIPSTVADLLLIHSIRFGDVEMLFQPVTASVFTEVAVDSGLSFYANEETVAAIAIENVSRFGQSFRCMLIGDLHDQTP